MPRGSAYESMGQRYCAVCHVCIGEGSFLLLMRAVGFFLSLLVFPVALCALLIGMLGFLRAVLEFNPLIAGVCFCVAWGALRFLRVLWRGICFRARDEWHYCESRRELVVLPRTWPHLGLVVLLPVLASWLAIASAGSWLGACGDSAPWEEIRSLALLGVSTLFVLKALGMARCG